MFKSEVATVRWRYWLVQQNKNSCGWFVSFIDSTMSRQMFTAAPQHLIHETLVRKACVKPENSERRSIVKILLVHQITRFRLNKQGAQLLFFPFKSTHRDMVVAYDVNKTFMFHKVGISNCIRGLLFGYFFTVQLN